MILSTSDVIGYEAVWVYSWHIFCETIFIQNTGSLKNVSLIFQQKHNVKIDRNVRLYSLTKPR